MRRFLSGSGSGGRCLDLKFRIVNLRDDYRPQPISDFSAAKNSFLEDLPDGEYVWYTAEDEEIPRMTYNHVAGLKGMYPYYGIRCVNLRDGRYLPDHNPILLADIVSNKVRFRGRVHELPYPRRPWGRIDFPIIHNHVGKTFKYRQPVSREILPLQIAKRTLDVIRGR